MAQDTLVVQQSTGRFKFLPRVVVIETLAVEISCQITQTSCSSICSVHLGSETISPSTSCLNTSQAKTAEIKLQTKLVNTVITSTSTSVTVSLAFTEKTTLLVSQSAGRFKFLPHIAILSPPFSTRITQFTSSAIVSFELRTAVISVSATITSRSSCPISVLWPKKVFTSVYIAQLSRALISPIHLSKYWPHTNIIQHTATSTAGFLFYTLRPSSKVTQLTTSSVYSLSLSRNQLTFYYQPAEVISEEPITTGLSYSNYLFPDETLCIEELNLTVFLTASESVQATIELRYETGEFIFTANSFLSDISEAYAFFIPLCKFPKHAPVIITITATDSFTVQDSFLSYTTCFSYPTTRLNELPIEQTTLQTRHSAGAQSVWFTEPGLYTSLVCWGVDQLTYKVAGTRNSGQNSYAVEMVTKTASDIVSGFANIITDIWAQTVPILTQEHISLRITDFTPTQATVFAVQNSLFTFDLAALNAEVVAVNLQAVGFSALAYTDSFLTCPGLSNLQTVEDLYLFWDTLEFPRRELTFFVPWEKIIPPRLIKL